MLFINVFCLGEIDTEVKPWIDQVPDELNSEMDFYSVGDSSDTSLQQSIRFLKLSPRIVDSPDISDNDEEADVKCYKCKLGKCSTHKNNEVEVKVDLCPK